MMVVDSGQDRTVGDNTSLRKRNCTKGDINVTLYLSKSRVTAENFLPLISCSQKEKYFIQVCTAVSSPEY